MSNEAQKLVDVKEKIKALNSELSGLLSEQKQLEEVIAKNKTDMPAREKLIVEWIEQQPVKFDITFSLNSAFSKEEQTNVRKTDDKN